MNDQTYQAIQLLHAQQAAAFALTCAFLSAAFLMCSVGFAVLCALAARAESRRVAADAERQQWAETARLRRPYMGVRDVA
jgi:hypothetical protein